MKRIKGIRTLPLLALWHDWRGHPESDVSVEYDYRPSGSLWGRCSSCGMSIQLERPSPYYPNRSEATTDEYRYGVDRSDA